DLAGPDPAEGAAAAAYWPLWSDSTYFPVPAGANAQTWANDLNTAYHTLVQNRGDAPLSNFANVINAGVTLPICTAATPGIQQYLEQAYQAAYGTAPPALPASGPFPVVPPPHTSPQDAVYRFLYNANLLRQRFYLVLVGGSANPSSLLAWVQETINGVGGQ